MIPQHYPIEPGILFGGEYPGHPNPEVARAKLRSLVEIGVRTFIELTTNADPLERYERMLPELELESGASLHRISIPVPDLGVPDSEEAMRSTMDAIRTSSNSNGATKRRSTPSAHSPPTSPPAMTTSPAVSAPP